MYAPPSPRPAGWTLVAVCALLLPTPGRAGFLTIQPDPNGPTIDSAYPYGTLTYNAASGNFHSDSLAQFLARLDPSLFGVFDPSSTVSIDLFVDTSGNFVSNGTGFVLTGEVDFYDPTLTTVIGSVSGDLLDGTITAFGAAPPGPEPGGVPGLFNGLFVIQGGQLTQPVTLFDMSTLSVYSLGQIGYFQLTAEDAFSGTLGDFSSSFSSTTGKAEAGPVAVPEPATVSLSLLGAGVLLGGAALRRRSWPVTDLRGTAGL
jgi:PEP-CTERM motif